MASSKYNERIASLLTSRSHISLLDLERCIRAVSDRCAQLKCAVFNNNIPTEDWYRAYIRDQQNMFLIDTDIGVSADTHGAVIKKKLSKELFGGNTDKFVYFIYISPELRDPMKRLFTIAHEIGHVLLHGRLLHPGMMMARRSQDWHQYRHRTAQLMEVEANLFALFSIIPDRLLLKIRSRFRGNLPSQRLPTILRRVLEQLCGCEVSLGMVTERIYIGNHKRDLSGQMEKYKSENIYPFSRDSWLLSGLPDNPSYQQCHSEFRNASQSKLSARLADELRYKFDLAPISSADTKSVFGQKNVS